MDQKVKAESTSAVGVAIFHKPCAFNPNGVSREVCVRTTTVFMRNRDGCCKIGCASPVRLCISCVRMGEQESGVVPAANRKTGLCEWHTVHGADTRRKDWRPYEDRSPADLPRQDASLISDQAEVKKGEKVEKTTVKPAVQESAVIAQKPEKTVVMTPALPVLQQVVQVVPDQHDTQEVQTSEEGRAILERVRRAVSEAVYEVVDINRIRPMTNQPRKYFNVERLQSLARSIKSVGQLMPGYLRAVEMDEQGRDRELIDGERRWRGGLMSEAKTYRAMRVDVDAEAAQYIVSIIANFNREGHTVLEIADSIQVMHDRLKLGMKEIAESSGFSMMTVSSYYGLRRLVPEVRQLLDPDVAGNHATLAASAAMQIARLPPEHQLSLAQRVMKREVSLSMLADEIKIISKAHGIPIRERAIDPSDQRKQIERAIDKLARQASDLKKLMKRTQMPILQGWNLARRGAYQNELTSTQDDIGETLAVFNEIQKAGLRGS